MRISDWSSDVCSSDLVLQLGNLGGAQGGDLVHAAGAVHHPGALVAEIAQHGSERLGPLRGKHPDELALHLGRVRQRPQQVEDGAGAELDARRPDVTHGAVVALRHEEAGAGRSEEHTSALQSLMRLSYAV